MERLPLNPQELLAEELYADSVLRQEEQAAHLRHHLEWKSSRAPTPEPRLPTPQPELSETDTEEAEAEFQDALARVPTWRSQLTSRGLAVGLVLGALFCVVTHKMNLGPGIIPSLNIAAGLLAFCSLKIWTLLSQKLGWVTPAFGPQECNAVQTFVTACSSVAFTGGFGTYVTAMDHTSYEQLGEDTTGNRAQDVYEPHLSRLIPYILSTSMIGVFMLVALRKTMIIDYNLIYPSGTATGLMIDSFFTKLGAKTAGSQLTHMARWFVFSVCWDAFKWIFSGTSCSFCSGDVACGGLENFPVFGMAAARWTFYLNLTPNIVGAGMICPHVVNLSMLLGAVLTWGMLWPYIASKEGDWYAAGQSEHAFGGLFGYKVFITIALLMGDGLYNLLKVLTASLIAYIKMSQSNATAQVQGYTILGSAPGACGPTTPSHHNPKSHATPAWYPTDAHVEPHGAGDEPGALQVVTGRTSLSEQRQPLLPHKRTSSDLGRHAQPGRPSMGVELHGSGHSGSGVDNNGIWQPRPHGNSNGNLHGSSDPLQYLGPDPHNLGLDGLDRLSGEEAGVRRRKGWQGEGSDAGAGTGAGVPQSEVLPLVESALEHRLRRHVFLSDTIPGWVSVAGFSVCAVLGALIIPRCYPAVKWYHVVTGFVVSPFLALPVSFGCGLTDWDVSSTVAKLAIFGFAGWAGLQAGGVVTGLAMAGVMMSATSTSACLMQDFRTGYIVKCAPRAMFVAQLVGAACGAILAPLTFSLFWATGKVGDPTGPYPTPYASIFRAMAIFGTQGVEVLPKHCGALMLTFFLGALVVNLARDTLPQRVAKWLPIPMAMAIPFVLGAYIAIDMAIGSLILALWEWKAPESAELLAPAVASGLIVGDGVFSIPLSIMGMLGIDAPLCMAFGSQATSA